MTAKFLQQRAAITVRTALALVLSSAGVLLAVVALGQNQRAVASKAARIAWPTVEAQLAQEYDRQAVQPGTALEALIRANQDFAMLREDEKIDKRGLPPWLRVWWRKGHPELRYPADDPTGGYPHLLKEILEWMVTHQDLQPGPGIAASAEADAEHRAGSVGGDLRISGMQTTRRSESDIRINYFDTTKIISGSNNIGGSGQQGMYYSLDSGGTWAQSVLPLVLDDSFHTDPTVEWTSDSRAWSTAMGIQGNTARLRNYFSTDNGATWIYEATPSGDQTAVDKQMVWADHSASSPYKDQMYAIWHNGTPAYMNRRTAGPDGTWLAAPVRVSGAESEGSTIGGDVKTNSAGDVFAAWPTTTSAKIFITKSVNGGASYSAPVEVATTFDTYDIGIPAFADRRALIYVSLGAYRSGATDNVYATWTDLSATSGCFNAGNEPNANAASTCKTRIWFSRSLDGGTTWSAPVKINDQPGLNDQFNQWLAVDEVTGGLGIIYYDTVADASRKKTDVYYQSSGDAGATWSAAVKVSTASTDETVAGSDSANQYGDYNGLSGIANTFFPSWTDRRNNVREEIWTAKITDTFGPTANLLGSSSTVTAGGCANVPAGTVNPGLPVTVSLCVTNNGAAAATNTVGTLQSTGGVTNPSGAQNYGAIAQGTTVCRSFSFTPSGSCGSKVTATLQLTDGAKTYNPPAYNFSLGAPRTTYAESFDGVTAPELPNGWTANNGDGDAAPWVTATTTPDAGSNSAFADEPDSASDKFLTSANIPIATSAAKLTFRNNFNLELPFDGGVLEISSPNINAGEFTDVTNAAVGGSFTSGGYTDTLNSGSALASRQAWTGNSGGYLTTVANLGPHVAGQTIKLRFRMSTDSSTGGPGWRVDSVSLNDGSICAPIPLSAVSRKTHNGVDYDVALPLGGAPGVEPRTPGAGNHHQVVVTFANAISASGASLVSGSGDVDNVSVAGAQAIVNLANVENAQTAIVNLEGVSTATELGCVNIPLALLQGDSNGDRTVNSGDSFQVRSRSGEKTSAANFRSDVNVSGEINSGDSQVVKSRSGTGLP
jgi:hypothetical protein